MGQYEDLVGAGGHAILQQLYPSPGDADCPMSADAVDDYLNTGTITPAPTSLGTSRYDISASWRQATGAQALRSQVLSLGPGRHVIVRGTRPHGSSYARTHFFVMANVGGQIYVIDAMTRDITSNVTEYMGRQGFSALHYTAAFEASPQFTP